jgi:hypothetical protein
MLLLFLPFPPCLVQKIPLYCSFSSMLTVCDAHCTGSARRFAGHCSSSRMWPDPSGGMSLMNLHICEAAGSRATAKRRKSGILLWRRCDRKFLMSLSSSIASCGNTSKSRCQRKTRKPEVSFQRVCSISIARDEGEPSCSAALERMALALSSAASAACLANMGVLGIIRDSPYNME